MVSKHSVEDPTYAQDRLREYEQRNYIPKHSKPEHEDEG